MIDNPPIHLNSVDALAKRMVLLGKRFRKNNPLTPGRFRTGHYLAPICPDGRPAHKALVWYPTKGCRWAVNSGCTMCNFGQWENLPNNDKLIQSFEKELDKLDPGTRYMHIGPGGSVLRDKEIPARLRQSLIEKLHRFSFLESLGIESRVETMASDHILDVDSTLKASVKELSVDFGLESSSELIRRVAVNKHQTRDMVANGFKAVAYANANSNRNIVVDCYVLLKPIFLTEFEAIQDCVNSINWAYKNGASTVTIFVSTVKPNTIMSFLNESNENEPLKFSTPYYHSVFEVLKQLIPIYRRRTGVLGLTSGRPYKYGPRSCEFCKHVLEGLIATHNYTRDPAVLTAASEVNCPCKADWRRDLLNRAQLPLPSRFDSYLSSLDLLFSEVGW